MESAPQWLEGDLLKRFPSRSPSPRWIGNGNSEEVLKSHSRQDVDFGFECSSEGLSLIHVIEIEYIEEPSVLLELKNHNLSCTFRAGWDTRNLIKRNNFGVYFLYKGTINKIFIFLFFGCYWITLSQGGLKNTQKTKNFVLVFETLKKIYS